MLNVRSLLLHSRPAPVSVCRVHRRGSGLGRASGPVSECAAFRSSDANANASADAEAEAAKASRASSCERNQEPRPAGTFGATG